MLDSKRNNNIEWLRIVSMLLIVAYHTISDGVVDTNQPFIAFSTQTLFGYWGILGTDTFIIISAWFLSKKDFKIQRIISVAFQTFTWVMAYIVLFIFYKSMCCGQCILDVILSIARQSYIDLFSPLWSDYYWFITAYVYMIIASTFVNKLVVSLGGRRAKKVIALFSFVPIYSQFDTGAICSIVNFIYLYFLVAYIKEYGSEFIKRYAKLRFFWLLLILIITSKFLMYFLQGSGNVGSMCMYLMKYTIANTSRNSVVILLLSLLLFFSIEKKKPKYSGNANRITPYILGVYCFHENSFLGMQTTSDLLYEKAYNLGLMKPNMFYPVKFFAFVAFLFLAGIFLEYCRYHLFQKPFMQMIEKKYEKNIERINNWFNNF